VIEPRRRLLSAASSAAVLVATLAGCFSEPVPYLSMGEGEFGIPACPPGERLLADDLAEQVTPVLCEVDLTEVEFPDGYVIEVRAGGAGSSKTTYDDGRKSFSYGWFHAGHDGLVVYTNDDEAGRFVDMWGTDTGITRVREAFGDGILERQG
jgi:hypothetical protein